MNISLNQPRIRILLIALAVILVAVFVVTLYAINKKAKKASEIPVSEIQKDNADSGPRGSKSLQDVKNSQSSSDQLLKADSLKEESPENLDQNSVNQQTSSEDGPVAPAKYR